MTNLQKQTKQKKSGRWQILFNSAAFVTLSSNIIGTVYKCPGMLKFALSLNAGQLRAQSPTSRAGCQQNNDSSFTTMLKAIFQTQFRSRREEECTQRRSQDTGLRKGGSQRCEVYLILTLILFFLIVYDCFTLKFIVLNHEHVFSVTK